ncbi:MAG TPA: cytochrome c oxidase subunit II [Longimicrobiales bacterium]
MSITGAPAAAMAVALAQDPVQPRHPWDALVAALNEFYRRALGLPEQASTIAPTIDHLHYFQITVMFAVAGVIGIVTTVFVFRYRRRAPDQIGRRVDVPHTVEVPLYTGLFALFMLFWIIGFRQFTSLELPPGDALDVYVSAKQWVWKFAYAEGPTSVGVLYVPAGRPVRLRLTSRDVIHSFFVPAFRIKRDAVPGMYTAIWFEAVRPGRYPVLCAELCGVGHSRMRAEVVVLSPQAFDDWRQGRPALPPPDAAAATPDAGRVSGLEPVDRLVELGRAAAARHGCLGCHSVDGSPGQGPTWLNLFGARETMQTGEVIYVNAAYITQSMMDPEAEIVAGFPPIMPSFQGRITPAETAAIIEYMKALSPAPGLRRGREYAPVGGAPAGAAGAAGAQPPPAGGATTGAPGAANVQVPAGSTRAAPPQHRPADPGHEEER